MAATSYLEKHQFKTDLEKMTTGSSPVSVIFNKGDIIYGTTVKPSSLFGVAMPYLRANTDAGGYVHIPLIYLKYLDTDYNNSNLDTINKVAIYKQPQPTSYSKKKENMPNSDTKYKLPSTILIYPIIGAATFGILSSKFLPNHVGKSIITGVVIGAVISILTNKKNS